jgi:hypothetical protein
LARQMAEGGKTQAALMAVRGKSLPAEARRAKAGELAGEVAEGGEEEAKIIAKHANAKVVRLDLNSLN